MALQNFSLTQRSHIAFLGSRLSRKLRSIEDDFVIHRNCAFMELSQVLISGLESQKLRALREAPIATKLYWQIRPICLAGVPSRHVPAEAKESRGLSG